MKTNQKIKKEWQFCAKIWKRRTKAIASIIPPEASIIELGGGFSYLKRLLPKNQYKSIDIKKWNDLTVVADFNKGEFPDMEIFDVIVCQGILEYIEQPSEFLRKIQKYGRRMLLSYRSAKDGLLTFENLDQVLYLAGWEKNNELMLTPKEKILYCTRR